MALETGWLGAAGSQGSVLLAWWSSGVGWPWQVSLFRGEDGVSVKLLRRSPGSSGESCIP